jgi:hypothetical protein
MDLSLEHAELHEAHPFSQSARLVRSCVRSRQPAALLVS